MALSQPVKLFHFFVQKRINVLGVNKRCVQVAMAKELACRRERDSNRDARCCKSMPRQVAMDMLEMSQLFRTFAKRAIERRIVHHMEHTPRR